MTKYSSAWKSAEKKAAGLLGGKRVIRLVRGMSCPDVEWSPDHPFTKAGLHADVKHRQRWALHTLFYEIQSKYGPPLLLITHAHRSRQYLCTIELEYLVKLLNTYYGNDVGTALDSLKTAQVENKL